jgi:uncharacterized SAM-binding protein YcdF (DUF218 family)
MIWLVPLLVLAAIVLYRQRWLMITLFVVAHLMLFFAWPERLVLQRMLAMSIMPVGLIWLGLGLLSLLAWLRRWPGRSAITVLFLLLMLFGNPVIGSGLLRQLEAVHPPPAARLADWPQVDAVAVLGGGTEGDGSEAWLGPAGDRVMLAARLYHLQRTRRLLTSGSSMPEIHRPRDLSRETALIWQSLGIPATAIEQLPDAVNTRQEIAALHSWQQAHPEQVLAIVSSAWHLPRIAAQCQRQELVAQFWPAARSAPRRWSVVSPIPRYEGLECWTRWWWELIGRLIGR